MPRRDSSGRARDEVRVERRAGVRADRHDPLLRPLAAHPQHVAVRDVVDVELHHLGHARARRVEQLEQRAVPDADHVAGGRFRRRRSRRIQQLLDLIDRERLRQPPRQLGRPQPRGRVVRLDALAGEEAVQAAHRRLQSRDRGCRGWRLRRRSIGDELRDQRRRDGIRIVDAARREPLDVAGEVAPVGRRRCSPTGPRSIEMCRRYASTARSSRMSAPVSPGAASPPPRARPTARMPLRSRPSRTPVTASASGTHSMRMSASSASRACASPTGVRPAGEEEVHDLVVAAGRREDAHERLPVVGAEVGLFDQLALRGLEGRLPLDVEQPRRDLPVAMTDRMPVLLDQQHAARRRRARRSPRHRGDRRTGARARRRCSGRCRCGRPTRALVDQCRSR